MSDRVYPKYYCCDAQTTDFCAEQCRKADEFILKTFGQRSASPHGFYDPEGFEATRYRNHRRNAITKLLITRYIRQAIRKNILRASPHPTDKTSYLIRLVN